jgi:ZIP family zinc transporter
MEIIIMSLFAGVVGMGLGGVVTAVFGSRTEKMISIFLSLAGGVMISIVLIELIPEAIEYSNVWVTIIGLAIGAVMVLILHNIMDRISKTNASSSKLHESYADFFHSSDIIDKKKSMLRSGMIMLFAIALHNIPEGLAMGAAGYHDVALGLTIAIMIGLHNIPEGMAISAPLISGGFSKLKTVLLVTLTGATTVLGTIIGLLVGGISDIALALSFAIASGAMLYVVFGEILPQSIVTNKDRIPTIFALVGIVLGIIFTQI